MKKNIGLKINWAIGAAGVLVSLAGVLFTTHYVPCAMLLIASSTLLGVCNTLLIEKEK
jgi:hypothetical protein